MGKVSIFELFGDAILGTVLSIAGLMNPAIGRVGLHESNKALLMEVPEIETLSEMKLKGIIDDTNFYTGASYNGFKKEGADYFLENAKLHLSPYDLVSLFRRKVITKEDLVKQLEKNKIVGQDVEILLNATEYFPTPADLVRFAIREVYSTSTAEKFGQFEDLPEIYLQEAEKAGLPREQAKNYWAAHWDLPSAQMGFEMLHRGVIDEDTLSMLLKALDVMPFWREKLKQISYNPLTRVDTRRMYTVGILNEEGVYRSFLDEGYSPENAKNLTDFTLKYDNPEIESLTRASLVDSYKKDIITREQLIEYFKLLSYTDNIMEFWLNNADYEKMVDRVTIYSDDIAERYQMGDIDLNQARQELLNLNVQTSFIDAVLEKMIAKKAKRNKIPTLDDLRRWLSSRLISEEYFVRKMRGLGYKDEDIEIYLSEISNTTNTGEPIHLSVETYIRYMQKGIISPKRFTDILRESGVPEDQIAGYLTKAGVY